MDASSRRGCVLVGLDCGGGGGGGGPPLVLAAAAEAPSGTGTGRRPRTSGVYLPPERERWRSAWKDWERRAHLAVTSAKLWGSSGLGCEEESAAGAEEEEGAGAGLDLAFLGFLERGLV